jgi:hypothetical protein
MARRHASGTRATARLIDGIASKLPVDLSALNMPAGVGSSDHVPRRYLGEGMRVAIAAVRADYEEMIVGWRKT